MTPELDQLLCQLEPGTAGNLELRLRFGLVCARRVAHQLEQPEVLACLDQLAAMLNGQLPMDGLPVLAATADGLASRHPGSKSLDGVGHAAVSATYACAKALAGQARQAAEYAAYSAVYGQGGYGATADPASFVPEFEWQAAELKMLWAR